MAPSLKSGHTLIVQDLTQLIADTHFHHWNTTSYAQHKALDDAYDALLSIQDTIAEALVAYNGRFDTMKLLPIPSCSIAELPSNIMETASQLKSLATSQKLNDLINIADEVTAIGSRLKYLLTLK